MFRNYLKIAWRNLKGNKVFSFINILGLAIGITTCSLIALYVLDETAYDKQFADGERVYRIASESNGEKWVALSAPVGAGLKLDFPEVEQVSRLLRMPNVDKFLLKNERAQKQFYETNGYYVDSTFFRIFDYEFKYGNSKTALDEPNSIIISNDVASRLFGEIDPVGQIIKVGLPFATTSYTVKGVLKNSENKSHIPAHMFLSMNNADVGQWAKSQTNWATNSIFHTYVKLASGVVPAVFEGKLKGFLERNGGSDVAGQGFTKTLFIQLLRDIYLHSNFGFEIAPNGNIRYLYIFSSIAAFLLLIACINFMNLSTARSEKRSKEVGVRKVIGAVKSALIAQFLGESLLLSVFSLGLSFLFIQLLLPVFNQLTGKDLILSQHIEIFAGLAALTLFTGLVSGFYPAFYLSSFKPIIALKGKARNNLAAVVVRKGLVVFQFTISIILILGAILVSRQMDFMSNQNLGFSKSQKLVVPLQSTESGNNYQLFRNELTAETQVVATTKASTYPGIENVQDMLFYAEGRSLKENVDISTVYVDNDYVKTLGIKILSGRSFSKEFTADTNSLVLNEMAVEKLGYNAANAVGKKIYYEFQGVKSAMTIIGVVKNYHFEGLQEEIKPIGLSIAPLFSSANNYMIIDLKSDSYEKLLSGIETLWKKVNPGTPFEYSFLDKDFQKNYQKEERTAQLIRYFALVAIFIACLGLFGLATFTAEQRTKEIGVRKVLGASIFGITRLLSEDFLKLVFVSVLIASPVAWWGMNIWLKDFTYKIQIEWWMFASAGVLAAAVALMTISFQSIKAALMNPVKALRSE